MIDDSAGNEDRSSFAFRKAELLAKIMEKQTEMIRNARALNRPKEEIDFLVLIGDEIDEYFVEPKGAPINIDRANRIINALRALNRINFARSIRFTPISGWGGVQFKVSVRKKSLR